MTDFLTVSGLGALAHVSPQAVYQWIEESPYGDTIKEKLGGLNAAGRLSLADGGSVLRAAGRLALAELLEEFAVLQAITGSMEAQPELPGVKIKPGSAKGRPPKWNPRAYFSVEHLAQQLGRPASEIKVATYRKNADMFIRNNTVYVSFDDLPESIRDELALRQEALNKGIELERSRLGTGAGEMWIRSEDVARHLGWSRKLVAARGWRTPWKSRMVNYVCEYELSSLPAAEQHTILKSIAIETAQRGSSSAGTPLECVPGGSC
jgi:hypothetical protein